MELKEEKRRAQYGDKLLKRLEDAVNQKGLTVTLFQWARRFYTLYPQIEKLFYVSGPADIQKYASVMPKLESSDNEVIANYASVMHQFISSPEAIISRLSFTYLREIMSLDDPLVRYFYEQEWTTSSSSQPTSSSCRTKAHWKNSCCGNAKKINDNYQRERRQSDTPTDIKP